MKLPSIFDWFGVVGCGGSRILRVRVPHFSGGLGHGFCARIRPKSPIGVGFLALSVFRGKARGAVPDLLTSRSTGRQNRFPYRGELQPHSQRLHCASQALHSPLCTVQPAEEFRAEALCGFTPSSSLSASL